MSLPTVRNINKGKRRKKKHYFEVGDPVVFKFHGDRDFGFISELTKDKDGYAQYTIRATGRIGCIYSTMELDDPDDPYSFISSVLTKSISDKELERIKEHKSGNHVKVPEPPKKVVPEPPKKVKRVAKPKQKASVNKTELKKAIKKQKDFLNGNVDKSFW